MMNKEQLVRQLLIIAAVILLSVVLIRSLSSGETLLEYADKNNIPIHSETETEEDSDVDSDTQ